MPQVGARTGIVHCLKLSPNLRKQSREAARALKDQDHEEWKLVEVGGLLQRWKKMHAAYAPRVLNFHSCANFGVVSRVLLKVFGLFCAILGIFANFA